MKPRHAIAPLLAAFMLLALAVSPTFASTKRATAPEFVQSNYASYTNCTDIPSVNYWTGKNLPYNSAWVRDGISMLVDLGDFNYGLSTVFEDCSDQAGTDIAAASTAWTAFVGTGGTQIIQIGMIACDGSVVTDCNGNPPLKYFWAAGGCGVALPTPHLFGAALVPGHVYQFEVYVDGTNFVMAAFDTTASGNDWTVTIARSDGGISCWDSTWGVSWMGERNDRGDGLGSSVHKTTFVDMYTHHAGLWALTSFGPGSAYCEHDSPSGYPSSCWILTGGNDMEIYTGN